MFTKKRILQFCAAALIFLLADFWMYSTLSSNFRGYEEQRNFNEIELFAQTVPEESTDTAYETWIPTVKDIIPGSRALYLAFDESTFDFVPLTGSQTTRALFDANKPNAEFQKALESVYYLEPMRLGSTYKADYALDPDANSFERTDSQVYFVPVIDDTGYQVSGAVMILVPTSTATGFNNLLRTLFIAAAVVFLGVLLVLTFTRDPMTGFMVLGLFSIVLIFIAYPLIEAVRLSFMKDGTFSLQTWKESLSPTYLVALWGSLRLGVLTATISTLVGYMFAFLIERTSFRQKKLMTTLATMPVISPPFSLSLSIILLFGNNGLISKQLLHLNTSIYGLGGLTIVQVIGMFPIAFMTISSVLRQIDSTVEDASLDLSATRWQTFKSITLPLSAPGILSAWLLVFTNSLADFANPLLLSGDYRVLSTEAYMLVTGRSNLGAGSALSFILLMPTLTAFLIQRNWVSKKSFVTVTGKPSTNLTELTNKPVRMVLEIGSWIFIGFIGALYLTIVAGCFVVNWGIDYSFTLANWGEAVSRGWTSIRDTVTLAAIATPIAGLLAMLSAMLIVRKKFPGKRFLEMMIMTPYAIPGTLIGISYVLAFNKQPLLLVGTGAIIVINYIIRELPVGLENGITALHQIDPAIEESAADLGADVPTVFRTIVLPLIRPAFLSSMSYTFVRSMTAVSAIIFLISARWNHLTVLIFNFSENLRFGLASVLSTILIFIVLSVWALMQIVVRDDKLTQKTISTR
ncbi:MAG: iron ABC transporter permease [Sphaerochaeta sp.]|jgi:iron(III) transport system permease protein|uniref:ABC transporter permease n=1 Tax=Sphaerochaeta sp. TaxID=1972642 RepID=UPI00181556DA|nr:iron ABC transporter permease [Sphaerochaeta sp.]MDD4038829.1 iron ABC transporter permease [Sphaerochaeta sp.]MDX9983514.1 iron ABC transporter permease [Sphaerochaeta sp.]NLA98797.1 iron ABC transporter permease [Spirochaetales bacterium]